MCIRDSLGGTIYRGISSRIWDEWTQLTRSGDNLANHPRPVLAALCHVIAEDEGLPVGVQIVAEYLEDRTALNAARLIEAETEGFVPPPAFASVD